MTRRPPGAGRDVRMLLATADSLVEALRGRPILRPEQFARLERDDAPARPEPAELARTLVRRGWLTVYQARKILAGRAEELILGQYVILDKLGEGGMGRVFKATQLSLHRTVALKVVRAELVSNRTALKRFRREVKAAAGFRHPHIVGVYDADQVGNRHFLAMEYIEGRDLAQLVKERGPLPVPVACSYARQTALGLQHAHERGAVHRDIKPGNLLVATGEGGQYGAENVVKILDLGLARFDRPGGGSSSTELTRAGIVIGTPDYMSPEQCRDSSAVDHRSDLYSLGCTFYYLLAGHAPFTTGSPVEKLLQHQSDPPPPVRQVRPEVPPEVAAIVECLLAKAPEDRFQSAAAVARALEPWCGGPGAASHNARPALAEAADPASGVIDPEPGNPFNFDSRPGTTRPPGGHGPPPLPRTRAEANKALRWVIALAAVFAVFLMLGALGAAILLAGR